jgi:DNA ligase (NAD+)
MNSELIKYFRAKDDYYDGNPSMSDSEFDTLELKLSKKYPDILKRVGSEQRTGKVELPIKMGSLNQIRNEKEWAGWNKKYPKEKLVFTEKIDGNSCLLEYCNGFFVASYSRGDGKFGAQNFRHTSKIKTIPAYVSGFTGYVRGELVIPKKQWNNLLVVAQRDYANARNFVAGFVNATTSDPALYKFFDFVAFEVYTDALMHKSSQLEFLKINKFICPKTYHGVFNYSEVETLIHRVLETSEYEVDGVVAEVDAGDKRTNSDSEDLNPDYACKIKLISEGVETRVLGVEWSASKDGLLKPVVLIEPVVLDGATISRATGYNAKFIKDNGIGTGAIVSIVRSGAVIPKIVGVILSVVADLPEGSWNETGVDLIGHGVDDEILAKQLQYFFHKMEIDFVGEGNVAKLIESGYTSPSEIIRDTSVLEKVIGENGRKASLIMNKVLKSTTPQRLFTALGSFGRGMGERKLKVLFGAYDYSEVLSGKITQSMITSLQGFDTKSANMIFENIDGAKTSFDSIRSHIKFEKEPTKILGKGELSGETIVATGVRFKEDQIKKIEASGGTISDALNKNTTILVVKDISSSSSKMVKATSMGIKIMSLVDFSSMIG